MMTQRHDELDAPGAPSPAGPATAVLDPRIEELREHGLRATAPRIAALAAIAEDPHADADAIATAVRQRLGTVSRQAVYDVLHALTAAGLVRRISLDERRARFELARHDNHHHLVCRRCGRIEDVACAEGAAPCLDPEAPRGFVVEQADVIYRGLCADCAASEPAAAP